MTKISPSQTPVNIKSGQKYWGTSAQVLINAAIEKGFYSNEWGTESQWNRVQEYVGLHQYGTVITFNIKNGLEGAILYNRAQLVSDYSDKYGS